MPKEVGIGTAGSASRCPLNAFRPRMNLARAEFCQVPSGRILPNGKPQGEWPIPVSGRSSIAVVHFGALSPRPQSGLVEFNCRVETARGVKRKMQRIRKNRRDFRSPGGIPDLWPPHVVGKTLLFNMQGVATPRGAPQYGVQRGPVASLLAK